jgi:chlorite dismutase
MTPPDLSEKGGLKDGEPQRSDRRLYMQLLGFGQCRDAVAVANELSRLPMSAVVYEELNDVNGIGILAVAEDPNAFLDILAPTVKKITSTLVPKPEYSMFGRTYSLGYEPDLQDALTGRPLRAVMNPEWPWAIWYPLRRSGAFAQLPPEEQRGMLAEHGALGKAFGAGDFAHDVRLACHGLDRNDNDFLIGLIGKDLFPLSALVQAMRKTQQTSLYLDRLGPFFVGRKVQPR